MCDFKLIECDDTKWVYHGKIAVALVSDMTDRILRFHLNQDRHESCIAVLKGGTAVFVPLLEAMDRRIPPSEEFNSPEEAITVAHLLMKR